MPRGSCLCRILEGSICTQPCTIYFVARTRQDDVRIHISCLYPCSSYSCNATQVYIFDHLQRLCPYPYLYPCSCNIYHIYEEALSLTRTRILQDASSKSCTIAPGDTLPKPCISGSFVTLLSLELPSHLGILF